VPEGSGTVFVESEKHEEKEIEQVAASDANTTMYYVNAPLPGSTGPAERHALTRLPIFAIFHGIAHERGVPPSFTGTLIVRSNVPPQTNKVLYRVQASSGSGQLFPSLAFFSQ
jgi:hypothetical protein